MKLSRTITVAAVMCVAAGALWWLAAAPPQTAPSQTQARYNNAAASAEAKLRHIDENGDRDQPDQTPTVLSELEINSYLNSGKVKLPNGVQKVQFGGQPGTIDATATVDFDAITASRRSSNPLLSLFRGVHDVHATAGADGSGGEGHVHIRSVDIDGVGVPRMALEYFVDRYVTPKYPGVGLDSRFKLPARVDIVKIGDREMTVTQK